MNRQCGILLHPTSLPGPFGIGDLGQQAFEFVDWLVDAGQTLWQILPLGPTGYGNSPYQPFSAFAGNWLLISPQLLLEEGLLTEGDLEAYPHFSSGQVDYSAVIPAKMALFRQAWQAFSKDSAHPLQGALQAFIRREVAWLDDYCLFMAAERYFQWVNWTEWPTELAQHDPAALVNWREKLADEIGYECFLQFLFDRQWTALHDYATERGISIIGDIPIFVGHESSDVWANQSLFYLDETGRPTVVAGVPPDRFAATGQLWGNPLYRWDRMAERSYDWWLMRLEQTLRRVDKVRLDHFRGFSGYWQVPAVEKTALNGRWVKGPGKALFDAIKAHLGDLPIIAEDLGLISQDVHDLRDSLGLPGMRVLQFGFYGDSADPHLPHNHPVNCVAYTATHDNDTTRGWFSELDAATQHKVRVYGGCDNNGVVWALVRLVYTSVASMAITPLQDLFGLGAEARLNKPGEPEGNWAWRFEAGQLNEGLQRAIRDLAEFTGRWVPPDVTLTGTDSAEIEYEEPLQ